VARLGDRSDRPLPNGEDREPGTVDPYRRVTPLVKVWGSQQRFRTVGAPHHLLRDVELLYDAALGSVHASHCVSGVFSTASVPAVNVPGRKFSPFPKSSEHRLRSRLQPGRNRTDVASITCGIGVASTKSIS